MSNRTLPSFTDRVMTAVDANYKKWGNSPSPANREALAAIASTIERMASGTAERCTYLSSAPTGLGKSTTIIASLIELVRDPRYRESGAVVFLAQRKQVERFVNDLKDGGVPETDICILVGNKAEEDLASLACGEQDRARIIVATQAKLLSVVALRDSAHTSTSLNDFWRYQGEPRRVRIWDESIIPANPYVFLNGDIEKAIEQLRDVNFPEMDKAADRLEKWRRSLKPGVPTEVCSFMTKEAVHQILALNDKDYMDEGTLLRSLFDLQGQGLAVRADYNGNAVLHYAEVLPEDFAPFLITDASGELRTLYPYWHEGRCPITHLPSGEKFYDGLTIHHWDHASGRAEHRNNLKRIELVKAAASVFSHIPAGEEVLFVTRKHDPSKPYQTIGKRDEPKKGKTGPKGEDMPCIWDLLTPEQRTRAHFTTWGLHAASNDYKDCKHVVLVGVLQTPRAVTAATLKAAGRMDVDEDLAETEVKDAHKREAGHNILQAVGRIAVRYLLGDRCPSGLTAWMIFSAGGPMPIPLEMVKRCFPGATIEKWEPFGLRSITQKTGKREAFAKALSERLGGAQTASFEVRDLQPQFSLSMAQRFLVRDAVMPRLLAEHYGLSISSEVLPERRRGGKVTVFHLRRLTAGPGPLAE